MNIKRMSLIAALAVAGVLVGTGAATATDILTPPVATGCVDVSSGGVGVTTNPIGARVYPHSVTIHSVGDCV
jgi:hypothetical protein